MKSSGLIGVQALKASVSLILGNIPGLLFPILTARIAGATKATDVLFLNLSLVGFVVNACSSVAESANIPFIHQVREQGGALNAYRLRIGVILSSISVGVLFSIACATAAISSFGNPGSYSKDLAQSLLVMLPYVCLAALSSVTKGFLLAAEKFAIPLLSNAITPIVVVLALWRWRQGDILSTCLWAFSAGEGLKLLVLMIADVQSSPDRVRIPPGSPISLPVGKFLGASMYQALGGTLLSLYPIMDRVLASTRGEGEASLLAYAERMWQAPIGALTGGLLPVLLVSTSLHISGGGSIPDVLKKTGRISGYLFVGACVACFPLYLFRDRLFGVVFGGASLSNEEVSLLGRAFLGMVLGVPIYTVGLAYTRVVIALRQNRWLLVICAAELTVKCVLNMFLLTRYGIVGLAIATSLMYGFGTFALVAVTHGLGRRSRLRLP
jgi:putative peptidoglycan lipid II flippase